MQYSVSRIQKFRIEMAPGRRHKQLLLIWLQIAPEHYTVDRICLRTCLLLSHPLTGPDCGWDGNACSSWSLWDANDHRCIKKSVWTFTDGARIGVWHQGVIMVDVQNSVSTHDDLRLHLHLHLSYLHLLGYLLTYLLACLLTPATYSHFSLD